MNIFQKLLDQERGFTSHEFMGPVFGLGIVRVKINSIITDFRVKPRNFEGWGVFKTEGLKTANLIREASRGEIARYLALFPRTDVVICDQGDLARGLIAHKDDRFGTESNALVSIHLSNEVRLFDTVSVRFDGSNFIYERQSRSRRNAENLRNLLTEDTPSDKIDFKGLTKEERSAYALVLHIKKESEKLTDEGRIKQALERGGAMFQNYLKRGSEFVVTYTVGGETHRSVVREDLGVVAGGAGICLEGTDDQYNLQSLPLVIKEGQDRGLIYRMGDNRR